MDYKKRGGEVPLANTVSIRRYEGLKHSGDEADARYLAHLQRLGVLPTETILPPGQRAIRDLARKRMPLVRKHTAPFWSLKTSWRVRAGADQ